MNKVKYKSWTKTMTSEGTDSRQGAIEMIFCGCDTAHEREQIIIALQAAHKRRTEYDAKKNQE